ncbi:MAG: ATP synthase F1 subunit epsilon [Verrucomicrobiae bacterium]|nr:ATP synthase F1 subunit epsilon [Verrucomicrobiae bacterium]
MATFRLEVVTPEGRAYSDDVDSVVIPGTEGELGVLAEHMPLMTTIKPGELQIQKGRETLHFAVGEGFVEVVGDRVSVLTDMALDADHIDETKAEEALKRAETALQQKLGDQEVASTIAALEKSLAQLNVKRRRRGK